MSRSWWQIYMRAVREFMSESYGMRALLTQSIDAAIVCIQWNLALAVTHATKIFGLIKEVGGINLWI